HLTHVGKPGSDFAEKDVKWYRLTDYHPDTWGHAYPVIIKSTRPTSELHTLNSFIWRAELPNMHINYGCVFPVSMFLIVYIGKHYLKSKNFRSLIIKEDNLKNFSVANEIIYTFSADKLGQLN